MQPQSSRPFFDDTTLEFAPTPMTTLDDDDLHVFSIQSTIQPQNSFEPTPPPPKKIRFKPTTKKQEHRQFEFPKEAFEEDNSIQTDFTPKFFVDPGMKEKFAIIKVKNHNTVERVRSSSGESFITTTTSATTSGEDKTTAPANFITTLAARRNRLLKKEKNSLRRRKVKRVKGQRRLKTKLDENTLRGRKRLPLIRKSASTTSFSSTTSVVQTTSSTSEGRRAPTTTTTPVATTLSPERSSKKFRIFNSGKIPEAHLNQISEEDGKKEEDTPDARVIELTNNILELKEKLELLKKELDM